MEEHPIKNRQPSTKIIPFIQTGEYYFKKGLKAYRQRNINKSKKHLERAVQLEPKEPIFICQLAVVLTEIGDYQLSNKYLSSIIEDVEADMPECFYFMANNYAHLGLFQEAGRYADMYLEREPDGDFAEDTEELLDLLSFEADEFDESFDQDELIVKQEDARELLETGRLDDAISLLKEIIQEYPEFWSAYNNLALAYFYSGDVEKASEILNEVLEKNLGNLHALCNTLVFLYYQRQTQKVKELTRRLESIHPILVEHRYKLGATFGLIGRYDLAYKWLRNLHRNGFQGDETFYYWLSYSAYFTNHLELSKNAWKKVLEENPDKKGSEPWLSTGTKHLSEVLDRWLTGDFIEERLYGLFLASKTNSSLLRKDFKHIKFHATLEQEFANYVLCKKKTRNKEFPAYIIDGYRITDLLFLKNKNDDSANEELYLTWLMIYDEAVKRSYDVSNLLAWAGATEYIWRNHQSDKITQKQVSEKYKISKTTLAKYVKFVKELLQ
ncbi:tetratricopeptide repeat protein [Ferdinandcohnia quinoae]|uniref:Tetratricopeptide repeat protein n=1 Tax=Fredinandcohnia quinoae TaxID=2918902 RepID=A0AAW5DYR5_9BACI|nr:tetratricopeptide repeat protein [Fredinandcohnia sp. SECRCQ15]MCH1625785.1 tetratricopeptide repeat protein [Fredinandcohnia sp. SECRCQ15]